MRKFLTVLAILCAIGVIGAWVATGADLGWTKTKVEVMELDPVTEIEFPVWKDKLVFGVDFLAGGLLGSLVLGGIAFFAPKKRN